MKPIRLILKRPKTQFNPLPSQRNAAWKGWVYCDSYPGAYNGFFRSADEFMEQVNDDLASDPHLERPPFVWATVSRLISHTLTMEPDHSTIVPLQWDDSAIRKPSSAKVTPLDWLKP